MDWLQRLYDSEINFEIATLWDGGFDWRLGDHMNGYKAEGNAKPLEAAIGELVEAALKHYPRSAFAIGYDPVVHGASRDGTFY